MKTRPEAVQKPFIPKTLSHRVMVQISFAKVNIAVTHTEGGGRYIGDSHLEP